MAEKGEAGEKSDGAGDMRRQAWGMPGGEEGGGHMVLETKRLLLREMNMEDGDALFRVLGDPEIMQHYPYTFDGQRVRNWIGRT